MSMCIFIGDQSIPCQKLTLRLLLNNRLDDIFKIFELIDLSCHSLYLSEF